MIQKLWVYENRKTIVCVDSYHNGVLKGRFYTAFQEMETFESLSQFLIKIENVLEEKRVPQSYTASRSFSTMLRQGLFHPLGGTCPAENDPGRDPVSRFFHKTKVRVSEVEL